MLDLLTQDPTTMKPTKRRLALLGARLACWTAPLLLLGLMGAAVAHFFFEVGNYPEPRARYAVGSLFLFLFAPVTGAIWYLARQRRRELRAAVSSTEEKS
ncbi:MAG: hypothetical protein KIT44_15650 [Opitutaceae bacterium]|nr:hypothetical protein [Opitutaceae bacterium]